MSRHPVTKFDCRAQSVVATVRRHPDVDHGDIRLKGQGLGNEFEGVPDFYDNVQTGVAEHSNHALPEENIIFSHRHSDRRAARG